MISHYHYDTKVFPFIIPVQEMIGEIDFTTIHERMDIVLLDREKDQSTELHKRFYSHFHDKTPEWEEFMKIYIPFVGPICESTCRFIKYKNYQKINQSDYVAIMDVGAYGASLSSNYNTKPLIAELLVTKKKVVVIRQKQDLLKLINY